MSGSSDCRCGARRGRRRLRDRCRGGVAAWQNAWGGRDWRGAPWVFDVQFLIMESVKLSLALIRYSKAGED